MNNQKIFVINNKTPTSPKRKNSQILVYDPFFHDGLRKLKDQASEAVQLSVKGKQQ
jgi:hypothetical protein